MKKWYRITIKNTEASGMSLATIISCISRCLEKTKFIRLYGIEGGGLGISRLNMYDDVMNIPHVIEACRLVEQFDWGDFVFVEDINGRKQDFDGTVGYVDLISKSLTTIRVIDSESFEIFTQTDNIVEGLLGMYPGNTVIEKDCLENFDYPE